MEFVLKVKKPFFFLLSTIEKSKKYIKFFDSLIEQMEGIDWPNGALAHFIKSHMIMKLLYLYFL